jgi:maltose/moltooligosaccharide transporter
LEIRTKKTLLLAGAILASAALFIMPNSPTLWFAAGMLWIMDASIVSMEPFRFLLAIIFRKNNVPWICHAKFFLLIGAYCIKTTVNFYLSRS